MGESEFGFPSGTGCQRGEATPSKASDYETTNQLNPENFNIGDTKMTTKKYATVTHLGHLKGTMTSVTQDAAKFTETLSALRANADKQRALMVDQFAKHFDEKQMEPYRKQYAEWHKRFIKETEPQRMEALSDLNEARESLSEFASQNLTDPMRLASGHGIGTESQYRIQRSLETAQPATLAMLARKASVEKDKDLGAVLVSIWSNTPRKERSYDAEKMADAIWGEEAQLARTICQNINMAFDDAMNAEREFNGTKTSPTEKLRQGLAYKGMERNRPAPETAPARKSSIQLIADGMESEVAA
jgi:hypothetical protein